MSKDLFHLLGGGVRELLDAAAAAWGTGEASLVGGWLLGGLSSLGLLTPVTGACGSETDRLSRKACCCSAKWAVGGLMSCWL